MDQSQVAEDEARLKALDSRFVVKKLGGVAIVVTFVIIALLTTSVVLAIAVTAFRAVYIEQVPIEANGPLILLWGSIAVICIGVLVSFIRSRLKRNRRDDSHSASRFDDD